ncbi:alpha/beta hydrolase [Niastella caeni]|uniref:Alpha/beta hydrolase n=1 Tax=Niastella caeni TaxID=2569763 RepID=A0A4S8HW49_9BACT|nr:alpha/beta hydrolase [Niastella caeni]THU39938.1 alpha/beta hydrolase [Niastella caeni]
MKVYFISGLAADKRVFKHIQLPADCEAVYLDWISPEKDESLPSYALRLAAKINREEPFALVGLSFGGMLATEIAKQYKPTVTILISSVPVSTQLPGYFKVAGKMGLHKIVPISLLKSSAATKRFFTRELAEDKKLLWQIINESDTGLIRWSMNAILNWKNDIIPQPVWHIHGKRDEVLPVRYTHPTHTIPKEGHMLVMTCPDIVNEILANALQGTALQA